MGMGPVGRDGTPSAAAATTVTFELTRYCAGAEYVMAPAFYFPRSGSGQRPLANSPPQSFLGRPSFLNLPSMKLTIVPPIFDDSVSGLPLSTA
jgi:hypothetical protein